jgi:hypothetical protein
MAGGGSEKDWEHLINFESSTLTEIKNLVGHMERMLEESQAQSKHNESTLKSAQWTLAVAVLALVVSAVLPFVVPLIVHHP